ncbi:hypothetical protein L6R53_30075 [Myxococcota bacterium]|nr:hypothetical protein [Myxococcota bacterium]
MPRPSPALLLATGLLACNGEFRPLDLDDTATTDGGAVDGGADGGADGGGDGGGDGGDGGGGWDAGGTGDGGTGDGGTGDGGTGDGGTGDGGTGDGGTGDGGGGDGGTGEAVDYCHLQWPCELTGAAGATSETVYLWVYEESVTEGVGAGSGLSVQVGVGADGSDPSGGTWDWSVAAWSSDKDGLTPGDLANDEYAGSFALPSTAGRYDYAGRVSADGGRSWLYCDLAEADANGCGGAGSGDGYDPDDAGQLTVE